MKVIIIDLIKYVFYYHNDAFPLSTDTLNSENINFALTSSSYVHLEKWLV